MKTLYCVDDNGNFLGGFCNCDLPAGSVEVPTAPEDARQIWHNNEWVWPREVMENNTKARLKFKRDEILNDSNETRMFQTIQLQLMIQKLDGVPLDFHNGHLRVNGVDYAIDGQNALLYLSDLNAWSRDVFHIKNQLYDSLQSLTDTELSFFDVDSQDWPVRPDISTY